MRSAVIFLSFLFLPLSLPSAAKGSMPSMYSPFDRTHNGHYGNPSPAVSAGADDALMGCGRGRYRDPATRQCRGPADLH